MKPLLILFSVAVLCSSCIRSNLEILLDTLDEEIIESAINFANLKCEETLNMLEGRYLEYPQKVEESRKSSYLVVKTVEEFRQTIEDVRKGSKKSSITLEELIEKYETTLDYLEDQIPEGWEEQYSETSRDYSLNSYSNKQLKRIALLMHNDIVLNEAYVLKALYDHTDCPD